MPKKLSSVTRPANRGGGREPSTSDTSGSGPTGRPTAGWPGVRPLQPVTTAIQQPAHEATRIARASVAGRRLEGRRAAGPRERIITSFGVVVMRT